MNLLVQLPKFEGPLGLLLYLIRKEEMDIFDIDIHLITRQYFEFIKLMKELDLEFAGDFIAMAATLIHIKSRMLLPQYDDKGEIIEVEDPRKELVQKLLEYQKIQEAAKLLNERPWVGRDIWVRGYSEKLDMKEDEIVLEENALFSLISTYRKLVRSVKNKVHQVNANTQSIASRILEIRDLLMVGQRTRMHDLITALEERPRQLLITFLAMLELGKLGFVSLSQLETYGDIYIDIRKPIETDAITRVEEYDNVHSESTADAMLQKAQAAEQALEIKENEKQKDLEMMTADLDTPMELVEGEFILKDAEDYETSVVAEALPLDGESIADFTETLTEDMATDEEILAAEKELAEGLFLADEEEGNV